MNLVLLNQTPPIIPNISGPFDTSNFRTVKDDDGFVMTGSELPEEIVKNDKIFSQFTRGMKISILKL